MKSLRELIEKNKKLFIGLAIVGILYGIWNSFIRDAGQTAFSSEAALVDAASSEQGRAIVATLARLNTVSIDPSVLNTDLFLNLQDFSRPYPVDVPAGKINPFTAEGISTNPLTTSDLGIDNQAPVQQTQQNSVPIEQTQAVSGGEVRPGAENDAPLDPNNQQ